MANALIHILDKTLEPQLKEILTYDQVQSFLGMHKDLSPTFTELKIRGLIPDVKIGRYKSLFFKGEWDIIRARSKILDYESKLNSILEKDLVPSTAMGIIESLKSLSTELSTDKLFAQVRWFKKRRLLRSGQKKAEKKKSQLPTVGRYIAERWTSQSPVKEEYNPFSLAVSSGLLRDAPSVYLSFLGYDERIEKYLYTPDKELVAHTELGLVTSLGSELAEFLNA
jgi:hypothetical protein